MLNNDLAYYNFINPSKDRDRLQVFSITQKLKPFRKKEEENIFFSKS